MLDECIVLDSLCFRLLRVLVWANLGNTLVNGESIVDKIMHSIMSYFQRKKQNCCSTLKFGFWKVQRYSLSFS